MIGREPSRILTKPRVAQFTQDIRGAVVARRGSSRAGGPPRRSTSAISVSSILLARLSESEKEEHWVFARLVVFILRLEHLEEERERC